MARKKRAQALLFRLLDTNGDGTGTKAVTGNHSGAAEIYYIQPPAGKTFIIARMLVSIEDTASMRADRYGDLGAALTNGLVLRVQDDNGTIIDLTDGLPIQTNAHWGRFCYDVDIKTWGAGNELLVARWTFAKAGVEGIVLRGSKNERLELVANDDFTGLINHAFYVNGFE